MPFSFIEIEENKNRVIALILTFLVLFYFLTAYFLLIVIENYFASSQLRPGEAEFFFPPFTHVLSVLIIAALAALFHWTQSTSNLIPRMSMAVGALPIDKKDTYHQYFKNIVDEVSVALGGRPIEAMVIPSGSMNAFSLQDFNRRAVIGITEGLLSRLNRAQIEAVVAHEAGHIAAADSLSATVICSLSEIYEEIFTKLRAGLSKTRGRGVVILLLVFILLGIMNLLSKLLRYFISRQREYRADAIAVRLTRNPLSLAEALKLISKHWRGSGAQGARMESIFILNPKFNELDERENTLSDIFSTHPPVSRRIKILLDMAHLDEKTLEENLKNFRRASPVAKIQFKPDAVVKAESETQSKRWLIYSEQKWLGPFLLDELTQMRGIKPEQWVRREGQEATICAFQDWDLRNLFKKGAEKTGKDEKNSCPNCKTPLQALNYEGTPILKCSYCEGIFAEQGKISRIFIRKDATFSENTKRLAEILINTKDKFRVKYKDSKSVWILKCPNCMRKMRRQFFIYSYPVEIDRCIHCQGIWFDKQELEILQYIFENKEQFFSGKYF
ncbi:MAG: M48 family metalloprotease [Candidatus Omnitrophica bacterium]|nr:M48 family metalloprotease [Candidatus Omnitrophota bacterium]